MEKTLGNTLRIFICAVLTLQLVGCGTLMYPERRGQREGRIDAGVAILDGLGLLFGIIPGVIAPMRPAWGLMLWVILSLSRCDCVNILYDNYDNMSRKYGGCFLAGFWLDWLVLKYWAIMGGIVKNWVDGLGLDDLYGAPHRIWAFMAYGSYCHIYLKNLKSLNIYTAI